MKITPEWIEWKGGECPVGMRRPVTVTKRNGEVRNAYGDSFDWEWVGDGDGPYDIIAYCPLDIEPYKPQPKWEMGFNGLSGLYDIRCNDVHKASCASRAQAQTVVDALNAAGVEL